MMAYGSVSKFFPTNTWERVARFTSSTTCTQSNFLAFISVNRVWNIWSSLCMSIIVYGTRLLLRGIATQTERNMSAQLQKTAQSQTCSHKHGSLTWHFKLRKRYVKLHAGRGQETILLQVMALRRWLRVQMQWVRLLQLSCTCSGHYTDHRYG